MKRGKSIRWRLLAFAKYFVMLLIYAYSISRSDRKSDALSWPIGGEDIRKDD